MTTWHLPFCATLKIIDCVQVCIIDKYFHKFLSKFHVACPRKKAILVLEITWKLLIYFTISKIKLSRKMQ